MVQLKSIQHDYVKILKVFRVIHTKRKRGRNERDHRTSEKGQRLNSKHQRKFSLLCSLSLSVTRPLFYKQCSVRKAWKCNRDSLFNPEPSWGVDEIFLLFPKVSHCCQHCQLCIITGISFTNEQMLTGQSLQNTSSDLASSKRVYTCE